MRRRGAWAQLQRTKQGVLGSLAIPVVVHGDESADLVRIGESRIELEGFLDSRPSRRYAFVGWPDTQTRGEPEVTFCQRRVGRSEAGILLDGFAEVDHGSTHGVIGPLVSRVHPFQERIVGCDVDRPPLLRWM